MAIFWILIWQFASSIIQNPILIASPFETLSTFFLLLQTKTFWISIFHSFFKIMTGFFLATAIGTILAVASTVFTPFRFLFLFPMQFIKSVPVVSFIILALLWVPSKNLSILISFLMVLPVMYTNIQKGIDQTDTQLLEMAHLYQVTRLDKIRYMYIPEVLPFFHSSCSISLGLCFKSGITAEVIGLPTYSIGTQLYEAKLYLLTKELFAWTFIIIFISMVFETLILRMLSFLEKHFTNSTNLKFNIIKEYANTKKGRTIPSHSSFHNPIHFHHIHKQFQNQIVLHDFSLSITPMERIACMGPSGIGKTTISRLLLGLLTPDNGYIIKEQDVQIAPMFQENRLCSHLDAITNVLFTAFPQARTKQEKQLAISQIRLLFAQMELTDYENKPVSSLSGGMQRRVALARALLANSSFLLLDEPFKGLDVALKQNIMKLVKEQLGTRALLLITHDEAEAIFFECRIVRLHSYTDIPKK